MSLLAHILFVTTGVSEDVGTLAAALKLARSNKARVSVLVVCPPLPAGMVEYQEAYVTGLQGQVLQRVEQAAQKAGTDPKKLQLKVDVICAVSTSQTILEYAQSHGCDLLVKQADPTSDSLGFRSHDMALVRKFPYPVALSRLPDSPPAKLRVAVAVDPEPTVEQGRKLSLDLLRVGRLLSKSFQGELLVVSCWDYPFEDYLRHNAWFQVPRSNLSQIVHRTQTKHRASLNALVAEAKIGSPVFIEHLRGLPEAIIPDWAQRQRIDLLVLGSVDRGALSGLLMGKTSEDILRRVGCSVLTLKPDGFVSPVTG